MAWILVVVGVVHLVGIGWGLPGSDGWDNDGVAPRDIFPGLAATFTPGQYYTYPPVHLALLAIVTLPIVLVAAVRAPSLALGDLIAELLKVPYMTAISYVARSVSLLMSLGVVLFLARLAEEIRAAQLGLAPPGPREGWKDERVRRVGWLTAALVGLDAALTFYAHTTNLDVPYLFWGSWALLLVARATTRRQPRLLRSAFAFAVLAVGTKDQAYAMFLLAVPLVLAAWLATDAWAREERRTVAKEIALAVVGAVVLLVVVDGIVFNPRGFAARVRFLTGSASQDFVEYKRDWGGRLGLVADAGRYFDLQYPKVLAPLLAGGMLLTIGRARGRAIAVALLPLFVLVSFTLAFNFTSLRSNARFLVPQALMLAVYGGSAVEALAFASRAAVRWPGRLLVGVAAALALHTCIAVDVNLLFDPRYDAEAWLREHVRPGDTIETYGHNVYLPRFPEQARVIRVGPEPIDKRNPMPGFVEIAAPYADAPTRPARFIVLPVGWGWRYLFHPAEVPLNPGRRFAPGQLRSATDESATTFFEHLVSSSDAFAFVHESKYERSKWFPVIDVHGTSARPVWIYERKPH